MLGFQFGLILDSNFKKKKKVKLKSGKRQEWFSLQKKKKSQILSGKKKVSETRESVGGLFLILSFNLIMFSINDLANREVG